MAGPFISMGKADLKYECFECGHGTNSTRITTVFY